MTSDLLRRAFRLNPSYALVPVASLSGDERALLGPAAADDDCFGIVRPAPMSPLRMKSVCRATADLVGALGPDGALPARIVEALGGAAHDEIARLVLDEILEVSTDGGFVSGARARDLLVSRAVAETGTRTARLSLAAIRHGERLPVDNALLLSAQMYFYNRHPVTPGWAARCGTPERFARFMRLEPGSRSSQVLAHWRALPPTPETRGWQSWAVRRSGGSPLRHKLYVSPTLDAVPDALPTVLEVFHAERVVKFKLGADLPGIARPDKVVAYFEDHEALARTAAHLTARLAGIPAQGVPFSAEIAHDGLLSWGVDPAGTQALDAGERTSWRLWITHRIAAALLDSRRSPGPAIAPWQYALDRLQHDGIDTRTWTPTDRYLERSR